MLPRISMQWKGTFRKENGAYVVREKTFAGNTEDECRSAASVYITAMQNAGYSFIQGGFSDDYKDTIRRN